MKNRILNWKPSPFDERDFKFKNTFVVKDKVDLPSSASVNELVPEVYDQLDLGSCCFNSTGTAILYNSRQQNREIFPSRLFHYYITREYEGSLDCDCGAYLRNTFKMLNKTGVCAESTWPYVTPKFKNKPSNKAYNEAPKTVGVKYHALDNKNINELKICIADLKKPFVFGFNVYSSFFDNWKETMPIPKKGEYLEGGHAVIAVKYDDNKKAFLIKNSWNIDWQPTLKGHFWMPYSFITSSECSDFWVLESINDLVLPEPTPTPEPEPQPETTGLIDVFQLITKPKELDYLTKTFLVRLATLLNLPSGGTKNTVIRTLREYFKFNLNKLRKKQ